MFWLVFSGLIDFSSSNSYFHVPQGEEKINCKNYSGNDGDHSKGKTRLNEKKYLSYLPESQRIVLKWTLSPLSYLELDIFSLSINLNKLNLYIWSI